MLRVSLPMLLVVLKAWVTEMKETPCASNSSTSSTSLARSASDRVSRSAPLGGSWTKPAMVSFVCRMSERLRDAACAAMGMHKPRATTPTPPKNQ